MTHELDRRNVVVYTTDRLAGTGISSTLQQLSGAHVEVAAREADLLQALEDREIALIVVYFDFLREERGPVLLREWMRRSPSTPVLAVISGGLEEAMSALETGVRGLVTKDDDPVVLVNTARALLGGECCLAPTIATHIVQLINKTGRQASRVDQATFDALTSREQEITQMLAMGMTTKEIADRSFITRATVKTHISNILSKVNFDERSQIVAMVYRSGWLHGRISASEPS